MAYTVIWTAKAVKLLDKLPRETAAQIVSSIEQIRDHPFRHIRWLKGSPYFRHRVGKYRVILDIRRRALIIYVIKTGKRDTVYRDL